MYESIMTRATAEETGEEGFIGIYNSPLAMILLQNRDWVEKVRTDEYRRWLAVNYSERTRLDAGD